MEMIKIDGVELEGWEGINDRREDFDTYMKNTNGCGAGNAAIDLVPDTMWGLSVTPICNLHDDAYVFCDATHADFMQANKEFYDNLKVWITSKSNWVMRGFRLRRAKKYYEAVDTFGWSAFVSCKKELGEM